MGAAVVPLAASRDDPVALAGMTDPEPNSIRAILDRDRTVVAADTD